MCLKLWGLGCCNRSCSGHRWWSFSTLKHSRGSRGTTWGRGCGWDVPATLRSLAALATRLLTAALMQAWHLGDFGRMSPIEDSRSLVRLLFAMLASCTSQSRGGGGPLLIPSATDTWSAPQEVACILLAVSL